LALENLASKIIFPCRFKVHGCDEMLKPLSKGIHEQACPYRPIACPLPFSHCKWTAHSSDVAKHVCVDHKGITRFEGAKLYYVIAGVNTLGVKCWALIMRCANMDFLVTIEKSFGSLKIVMTLLSVPRTVAHLYTVKLAKGHHELMVKNIPRNFRDVLDDDCLVLERRDIRAFSQGGALPMRISIIQV
jgi:E3 ubiquitin-protein ligase SIAH1